MNSPLMTIVVPVFNCASYIKYCIESLLSQSYDQVEVIFVDDGSTDDSVQIINKYILIHKNFRLIALSGNSGTAAIPRNVGINLAKGEYIGFVDADDWVGSEMLSDLYGHAKQGNYDIVSSGGFYFHLPNGNVESREIIYHSINKFTKAKEIALQSDYFSNTVNRLYKRKFLLDNDILFPEIRLSEDLCFSIVAHLKAKTTTATKSYHYHYRYSRPNSSTSSRKGNEGFSIFDSFRVGLKYFDSHNIFDAYKAPILRKFINSFYYTFDSIDLGLKESFFNEIINTLQPFKSVIERIDFDDKERIRYKKLLETLKKIENRPLKKELNISYANNLLRTGKYDEAIKAYDLILSQAPPLSATIEFNKRLALSKSKIITKNNKSGQVEKIEKSNAESQKKLVTGRYYYSPKAWGNRIYHGGKRVKNPVIKFESTVPLVSIVTTVWNGAKYIEEAIKSVINQSYLNIEYIVIDGGSTDGTLDILKKYESYISYIASIKDSGIYDGMNRGIQLSHGEYILILNSDDYLEPDAITKLFAASNSKSLLTFGSVNLVDLNGNIIGSLSSKWNSSVRIRCPARHGTMLAKREAYDTIGLYNTKYKIISDQIWLRNAYFQQIGVSIINDPILNFRNTGVSSQGSSVHGSEVASTIRELGSDLEVSLINELSESWKLTNDSLNQHAISFWNKPRLRQSISARLNHRDPKISIHIPIFNSETTIAQCFESILGQEFSDFELVCIDDGSTDSSVDIVRDYSKKDRRILFFENGDNLGTLITRKKIMQEAQGSYMLFADSDDILKKDSMETLFNFAFETNADFIQFKADVEDQSNLLDKKVLQNYQKHFSSITEVELSGFDVFRNYIRLIKSNFWVSFVSKNVYKSCVNHIPDIRIDHGNDNYIMFLIAYFSKSFITLNKSLYSYRASKNTSNLTNPTPSLVSSQIHSRFDSIAISLDFLRCVNPNFSHSLPPIPDLYYSTYEYCNRLIQRCSKEYPEALNELTQILNLKRDKYEQILFAQN